MFGSAIAAMSGTVRIGAAPFAVASASRQGMAAGTAGPRTPQANVWKRTEAPRNRTRKGIATYVPGASGVTGHFDRRATYRGAAPRSLSIPVINEISDSWALTMPCASFFSTPTVHLETQPSAMWTPPL